MYGRTLWLGALALASVALAPFGQRRRRRAAGTAGDRRAGGGFLRRRPALDLRDDACRSAATPAWRTAACARLHLQHSAASACFLKSDDGARTPFPAALSALLVARPPEALAAAAARAGGSGVPAGRPAARPRARPALSVGFPLTPAPAAEVAAALDAAARGGQRAPTRRRPGLALAAFAAQAQVDDWDAAQRAARAGRRSGGRTPICARATRRRRPRRRGCSASRWRRRARGGRRSTRCGWRRGSRPATAIAAEVARAEGLYGFRRGRPAGGFRGGRARAPASRSRRTLAAAGVDYADFVRRRRRGFPGGGRATASSASRGWRTARATRVTLRAGLPVGRRRGAVAPRSSRRSTCATAARRCASSAAPTCCRRARTRRSRSARSTSTRSS